MVYQRNFARYAGFCSDQVNMYPSIGDFLSSDVQSGIASIAYGSGSLDLLIEDRQSSNLLVIFHAAVSPEGATLPVFVGLGVAAGLDASVVFVSDPALDNGVPIGWYSGDSNRSLQQDLPEVLGHISARLGCERTVFFGSSAGGFASLYYSHLTAGSLGICINPQTDIFQYHDEQVGAYVRGCWGSRDLIKADTEVLTQYSTTFPNHVLYLQNTGDDFHIANHLAPWVDATGHLEGERWARLMGQWGNGHAAPPALFQSTILEYALSFNGAWDELVADPEFGTEPW